MNIKELAKELCKKSPCHHKCHDTTDCVVEDEALLLINENKSNNFEVKSNNLPSTLTNEENVSVKGKQVEEMANDLYENRPYRELWLEDAQDIAEVLYKAGYRKQSEGEWLVSAWDNEKQEFIEIPYIKHEHTGAYCSLCRTDALLDGAEFGVASNYCPHCGAKMKGGE